MENRPTHWQNIYQTKQPHQVSWTQAVPQISLDLISELQIPKDAPIIDVGGGDSNLVDHLLLLGYSDITVLDISEIALQRAKQRLGAKAESVKWIVADIARFVPQQQYALWHDRAVFHFLTNEQEIGFYTNNVSLFAQQVVLGTFSEQGPKMCSGLPITQYSEQAMREVFNKYFRAVKCLHHAHTTPFGTVQNFMFCSFRKI